MTDEDGILINDQESNVYKNHQRIGRIYTPHESIQHREQYEDQLYEVLRRGENMHNETFSQAVARNCEENYMKTFDAWLFGQILYVCAEVALQKGKYKNVFPSLEERIDGFFTMVPGINNLSLLNAAITKRKFEISHVQYI